MFKNNKNLVLFTAVCLITGFLLFSKNVTFAAINPLISFQGKVTNVDGSELTDDVYDFKFELFTAPTGGSAIWTEDLVATSSFSATIVSTASTSQGVTYTYSGGLATSTLRAGQYLTSSSTSNGYLITDYNHGANQVTVIPGSPALTAGDTINNRPRVEGGVIDVNPGTVSSLSAIDFNQTLYLEVSFNGEVMRPRKMLAAVPQSFESERVGGKTEAELATLSEDETITGQWSFNDIVSASSTSANSALTITQNGSGDLIEVYNGGTRAFAVMNDGRIAVGAYYLPSSDGTPGYVLKTDGSGNISWELDISGAGGSGLWSTSSNELLIRPVNTAHKVVIGAIATTSLDSIFEVHNGSSYFERVDVGNGNELRFYDTGDGNYLALRASTTMAGDVTLTLPPNAGADGNALLVDGSGNMYWGNPSGSGAIQNGNIGQIPYYYQDGNNLLQATSSIFVADSQFVGIGTTSPSSLFSVAGNSYIDGNINITGNLTGATWNGNILSVDYGGTGTTTWNANALVYADADNSLSQIMPGPVGYSLVMGVSGPYWSATSTGGIHNLLSGTHGDTTAGSVSRGALIVGQGASPTWNSLALGTAGHVLYSDGTDAIWIDNVGLFGSNLAGTTTDALAEGTNNRYYRTVYFASDLAATTTSALAEGSNQYWTNSRFDARLIATTSLPNLLTLANLETVGTIATGTWQGDVVGVAYGGTGLSSYTQNSILFATSSNEIGEITPGGEGWAMTIVGGKPTWSSTSPGTSHSLLSSMHADVEATSTRLRGDIITVDVTGNWNRLGLGGNGFILRSDGADAVWSSTTQITTLGTVDVGTWQGNIIDVAYGGTGTSTWTANSLLYAPDASTIGQIPPDTQGQILQLNGSNVPTWVSTSSLGFDIGSFGGTLGLDQGGTGQDFSSDTGFIFVDGGIAVASSVIAISRTDLAQGSGIILDNNIITLDDSGNWGGTFDGQQGSYYLNAINLTNFNVPFAAEFAGTTTDALAEGSTNRYYKTVYFSTDLAGTSTDALVEGSLNKYYKTVYFAADLAATSTDALAQGSSNLYWNQNLFDAALLGTSSVSSFTALPNLNEVGTISTGVWNGASIGSAYGGFGTDTSGWNGVAIVNNGNWGTSSTLPVALGGTGTTTWTANALVYSDAENSLSQIIPGAGTDGYALVLSGGVPTWSSTSPGAAHPLLGAAQHSDTSGTSPNRGDLIAFDGSNWDVLSVVASGDVLYSDGTDPLWTSYQTLFANQLAGTSTDALQEGNSNRYYDTLLFASDIAGTSTDALSQGSTNLYYDSLLFAADLAATTTDSLQEGNNNLYSQWSTNGSDISYSSGSVGIGTATPNNLLDLRGNMGVLNEGELRMYENELNGNDYVAFKASTTLGSSLTWTLPTNDGVGGNALMWGADGLYWDTPAGTGGTITAASQIGMLPYFDAASNDLSATSSIFLDTSGNFMIGTTTSAGLLTVGSASGNQLVVNNGGVITQGVWQGTPISIAFGGTGATTATSVRENLALDEIYKFGINSTGTSGYLWQSDGNGRGQWVATGTLGIVTGGGVNVFVGTTTYKTAGSISTSTLTGYPAANELCDEEYSGSHFCMADEIITTIFLGDISDWTAVDGNTAWMAEGAPGYTLNSNDCNGWTDNTSTYYGPFWMFRSDTGGRGFILNCANSKSLACCNSL